MSFDLLTRSYHKANAVKLVRDSRAPYLKPLLVNVLVALYECTREGDCMIEDIQSYLLSKGNGQHHRITYEFLYEMIEQGLCIRVRRARSARYYYSLTVPGINLLSSINEAMKG